MIFQIRGKDIKVINYPFGKQKLIAKTVHSLEYVFSVLQQKPKLTSGSRKTEVYISHGKI